MAAVADVADGLRVDAERMRANLAATRGVVFAERALTLLAPRAGRAAAQRWIAEALDAVHRGAPGLASALQAHAEAASLLTADELSTLENPEMYLGAAEALRQRLLSS
jgi:3-carboxy-cis,cis-muconate cycloisomerase